VSEQPHDHPHQHDLGPSHDGSVVLDIGGDVGALVLHVPASLAGTEIDIFRSGDDRPLVHTAVRERRLAGGTVYAAVFQALPAGRYRLPDDVPVTVSEIAVEGGRVTEVSVAVDA
jgi:hypothetical protein